MIKSLQNVWLVSRRHSLSAVASSTISPYSLWSLANGASRRMVTFTSSHPLMERVNIKVPTMGDSITEGTIVEWTAQVGQLVKEGDVVALIETDKVTVDIKAEVDGVIMTQYGAVDDNVEVGADLYQIDTEATESPGGFFEVAPVEEQDIKEESSSDSSESPTVKGGSTRIPSINFLGKAGWAIRRTPSPRDPAADIAVGIPPAVGGPAPVTVDAPDLGPMYGRLAFSEKEMDALILGGADEAPEVLSPSRGAVFGT